MTLTQKLLFYVEQGEGPWGVRYYYIMSYIFQGAPRAPHHETHKLLNDNALRTTFRRKTTNFVNVLSVKSESLSFLSTDFFI